eukprot:scaffold68637_cov39-Prasinocladus_malaysianus.AAC.1
MRGEVKDDCAPIILKSSIASGLIDADTIAIIRRMYLGNGAVSQMDYYMCVLGLSPDEAAARWMSENPEIVQGWLAPDSHAPEQRLFQMGLKLPTVGHSTAETNAQQSLSAAIVSCGNNSSNDDGQKVVRVRVRETAVHLPVLADGETLLTSANMLHQSSNCARRQYEAKTMMKQAALNAIAEISANARAESLSLADARVLNLEAFIDLDETDPLIDADEV